MATLRLVRGPRLRQLPHEFSGVGLSTRRCWLCFHSRGQRLHVSACPRLDPAMPFRCRLNRIHPNHSFSYRLLIAALITIDVGRSQYSGRRVSNLNKYPGNPSIVMSFVFQGLSFCGYFFNGISLWICNKFTPSHVVHSFVICNFIVMRRLHSLAMGIEHDPLQERRTVCALALVACCIVVHFIACVVAAAFNDKM